MTIVAIYNPASGDAPDEDELRRALDGAELVPTTEEDPGPGQARRAVEAGADTVVACGGDGTVRACLDSLRHCDTALDIVPLGTGNLLAGNAGIPSGLDGAKEAGRRPVRPIDLGSVNGEAFAVMAGSGFDALMIGDADDDTKRRIGTLAYVISGAKNLPARLVPTVVDVDGDRWFQGRTAMVLVGNHGEMTAGLEVFPDAEPDDGLLDVAVLSAGTLGEWARVLTNLALGRPQPDHLVKRTQGRRIEVRTDRPRPYELDGEARDPASELVYEIDPGALRLHHARSA